ncbi:MAG TPA: outer membrane protein transport protein, partial [Acetobacteraceae bacterium]|nr:outer membrane protein transport protein [Acetobacteraceae bacterium]
MRSGRSGAGVAAVGFVTAGLAGLLGTTGAAHAAGFALREGTSDSMGNAFAGGSAKAYDAGTAYTNPAGMVRLNWNEIDAGLNILA